MVSSGAQIGAVELELDPRDPDVVRGGGRDGDRAGAVAPLLGAVSTTVGGVVSALATVTVDRV